MHPFSTSHHHHHHHPGGGGRGQKAKVFLESQGFTNVVNGGGACEALFWEFVEPFHKFVHIGIALLLPHTGPSVEEHWNIIGNL
jgi:hypothetical protein